MILVPTDTPDTTPELLTVATLGDAETQGIVEAAEPEPVKAVVVFVVTVNVPEIVGSYTVTVADVPRDCVTEPSVVEIKLTVFAVPEVGIKIEFAPPDKIAVVFAPPPMLYVTVVFVVPELLKTALPLVQTAALGVDNEALMLFPVRHEGVNAKPRKI